MANAVFKATLCLLCIALIFGSLGCAGRTNGHGGTDQATPTPAMPAASATATPTAQITPTPAAQPTDQSNYTTNLSVDDVYVSGADQSYDFPEDDLPTPSAE